MFGATQEGNDYYNKGIIVWAVGGTLEMHRSVAEPRVLQNAGKLILSSDETGIKVGSAVALRFSEIGEQLTPPARIVLKNWLSNPTTIKANALARASAISWLKETVELEVGTLTSKEIRKLNIAPSALIVDRVVSLICNAGSWNEIDKISRDCGINMALHFTDSHLKKIANALAVTNTNLVGSPGMDDILDAIAQDNDVGRDGLREILIAYDVDLGPNGVNLHNDLGDNPAKNDQNEL